MLSCSHFIKNDIKDLRLHKIYKEVYREYIIIYQNEEHRQKIIEYINQNGPSELSRKLYNYSYAYKAIVQTLDSWNLYNAGKLLYSNTVKPTIAESENLMLYKGKDPETRLTDLMLQLIKLSETKKFKLIVVPVPPKSNPEGSMTALKREFTSRHNSKHYNYKCPFCN